MSSPTDRLKASLVAIVDAILGPRLNFQGPATAIVVAQNADLTLELKLENPSEAVPNFPAGLQSVPLRTFVPGCTIRVSPGCRVQVVWEGSDRMHPRADLFDQSQGSLVELDVVATTIKMGSAGALPLVSAPAYLEAEATMLKVVGAALQLAGTFLPAMATTPAGATAAAGAAGALTAAQTALDDFAATETVPGPYPTTILNGT